jgi:hypothetical protein
MRDRIWLAGMDLGKSEREVGRKIFVSLSLHRLVVLLVYEGRSSVRLVPEK